MIAHSRVTAWRDVRGTLEIMTDGVDREAAARDEAGIPEDVEVLRDLLVQSVAAVVQSLLHQTSEMMTMVFVTMVARMKMMEEALVVAVQSPTAA